MIIFTLLVKSNSQLIRRMLTALIWSLSQRISSQLFIESLQRELRDVWIYCPGFIGVNRQYLRCKWTNITSSLEHMFIKNVSTLDIAKKPGWESTHCSCYPKTRICQPLCDPHNCRSELGHSDFGHDGKSKTGRSPSVVKTNLGTYTGVSLINLLRETCNFYNPELRQ